MESWRGNLTAKKFIHFCFFSFPTKEASDYVHGSLRTRLNCFITTPILSEQFQYSKGKKTIAIM